MRRLDEAGAGALVQTPDPVNRFPELVAELVATLKRTLPTMGKVRIAQVLARAGLLLAPTTVARFLKRNGCCGIPAASIALDQYTQYREPLLV